MLGILITIVLGGLAGFIASKLLNRDADMGIVLNIVVGVIGAALANFLFAPLFGTQAVLSDFSLSGFILSVLGAVVLLAIVNLLTRGKVR